MKINENQWKSMKTLHKIKFLALHSTKIHWNVDICVHGRINFMVPEVYLRKDHEIYSNKSWKLKRLLKMGGGIGKRNMKIMQNCTVERLCMHCNDFFVTFNAFWWLFAALWILFNDFWCVLMTFRWILMQVDTFLIGRVMHFDDFLMYVDDLGSCPR